MKLTLLAVGKLPESWVKEGCEEYARRLKSKLPLTIIEVKTPAELSQKWPARHRVWTLDERGAQLSSKELAHSISCCMNAGEHGIAFVIGGADGLPAAVVERADQRWSLGRLTLPHRLARLIVLEQLYRALSIIRGEPYHRQ